MFFPLWLGILMLLVLLVKVNYDSKIPHIKPCTKSQFDLESHLEETRMVKIGN